MGSVTIAREFFGYADRVRAYAIMIDGEKIGEVKNGETAQVQLSPGPHQIWMKIDWCSSPKLSVDGNVDTELYCISNTSPITALYRILFDRENYIRLWRA
jgi:hypothetical protein